MIRLDNVSKVFGTGVAGLSDITLFVDSGEFVFLVGHTGSGKTTLLRLLVRDTLPTKGTIIVGDFDVVKLPENKIPHLRKKVGVIFQDLKLLMDMTILENIILPMQVVGVKMEEAVKRAEELLQMVGLSEHRDKFPVQLSGGELQRVAIARALSLSPEILLADEPTGNLDPQTAMEIVQLLEKINDTGTTIVMATHNLDIVQKLKKRVIGLEKGKVVKDEKKHDKGKASSVKGEEKTEETKGKEHKSEESMINDQGTNAEAKDEKDKSNVIPNPDLIGVNDSKGSSKGSSAKPQNDDNIDADSKVEEHKKETRKLSDLLAKARLTLHKKDAEKDGMPFGFTKETDGKESSKIKAMDDNK